MPVCCRHKRGGGTSPPPAPQPGLLRPAGELSPREFGGVRAAPLSARLGHYTAVRDRGAPASRRTCYRLCGCESSFLRCLPAGCPRCCVCRLLSGSGLLPLPSAPPAGRRRLRSCARARVTHVSLCPASASLSAENRKWFSCLPSVCCGAVGGSLSFPRCRQWVRGSSGLRLVGLRCLGVLVGLGLTCLLSLTSVPLSPGRRRFG